MLHIFTRISPLLHCPLLHCPLLHCPLPHCPPLPHGAALSTPALSTPAVSTPATSCRIVHSRKFSVPNWTSGYPFFDVRLQMSQACGVPAVGIDLTSDVWHSCSYLNRLELQSLELRRLHLDLIWCCKIVFQCVNVNMSDSFQLNGYTRTRGHQYKLYKTSCSHNSRATFF